MNNILGLVFLIAGGMALGAGVLPEDQRNPNLMLSGGFKLKGMIVKNHLGQKKVVTHQYGFDLPYTEEQEALYQELKSLSLAELESPIQWQIRELTGGKVIAESKGAKAYPMYGASVTKIYIAGAYLSFKKGKIDKKDVRALTDLISVSDNRPWSALQDAVGGGDPLSGMMAVQAFVEGLGLTNTRAFRGWHHKTHGNETTVNDLTLFAYLTYQKRFPGAGDLWVLYSTCSSGEGKGMHYLPADQAAGGKTGSYSGRTVNAYSGKAYLAKTQHHLMTLVVAGVPYSVAILTDRGKEEDVAVMAGGLYREYLLSKKQPATGN